MLPLLPIQLPVVITTHIYEIKLVLTKHVVKFLLGEHHKSLICHIPLVVSEVCPRPSLRQNSALPLTKKLKQLQPLATLENICSNIIFTL